MTDSRSDFIEPRPEAIPLPFGQLTEEQRKAGEQATLLLRGMAQEPVKPPHTRSTTHSYLPVIYREHRGNRVVLLDGARGSGKSALLITLLDAYSSALSEQQVPQGYEVWLGPSDRIVPVGLVDLQPLPTSTNLLFHLAANLERVVEAMETRLEHPRLGTAAWHPGSEDESRSRRCWRSFVRIAASGWNDNLEARKGRLDTEAFAVEVEQGELQRLDVAKVFREFVDALVDDYRTWNHWQSGAAPLFLLAVDDADMNPHLAEPLLELVRKLWHPRLAFLLTGDSDLFLRLLEKKRPTLGSDIYAKVIPQRHRCHLPQLSPRQRFEKDPPAVGKLLQQFPILVQKSPSRPSGTLADYFELDAQVQEVLPGRLRSLWELRSSLESQGAKATGKASRISSDEAVERIWKWSLQVAPITPAVRERLDPMVRVDGTTRWLSIEPDFVFDWWSFEPLLELETSMGSLSFARPLRAEVFLGEPSKSNREPLDPQVASALVLAANFVSDAERLGVNPLELPSRLSTHLLAHSTLSSLGPNSPDSFAWPLPDWGAPLDIVLLGKAWALQASAISPGAPQAPEEAARRFLRTVLCVGLGESPQAPQGGAPPWAELASEIARTASLRTAGAKYQRALGEWALGRAGLLAAPESGLPAPVANSLLGALKKAFAEEWGAARQAIRNARLERARETFLAQERQRERSFDMESIELEPGLSSPEGFLQRLDQQMSEHEFRHLVEAAENEAPQSSESANRLRQVLENIHLRSLNRVLGEKHSPSLANYLTPLRWKWLRQAPSALVRSSEEALRLFTKIQDAGAPALASFWKAACESMGQQGLVDLIQLQNGRLNIDASIRSPLDLRREQRELEPSTLSFGSEALLQSHVLIPASASVPVLSVAAPRSVDLSLEAVLRMAYDHEEDHGERKIDKERPVGWRGLRFQFKNSTPLHLWFVPQWPSLFEWEVLEESWQEAVRLARGAVGPGTTPTSSKVLDGLAYWLLSQCQGLQSRNELSLRFKMEPSVDDWRTLLHGQGRARFRGKEVRPHIYKAWRSYLPLMATPEAGLSEVAATIILGVILKQSEADEAWRSFVDTLGEKKTGGEILAALQEGSANQAEWAQEQQELTPRLLGANRRGRLLDGIAAAKVDAFLSDIDRSFPDHPWVKVFGTWKGLEALAPSWAKS